MIDIHTHVLHGVDDGAGSIDEAVEMIREASHCGIRCILLTPHYISYSAYNSSVDENRDRLDELRERIKLEDINIKLLLGNEVYYGYDTLKDIGSNMICSLNDSRYMLVEVPRNGARINSILDFIFEIQLKDFTPIIAHPERYDFVNSDPNITIKLIEKGALIQVNLLSLSGRYGNNVAKTTEILLKHNMVHFLASDVHKIRHYQSCENAINKVINLVGQDKFNELVMSNPLKVINNEIFYPNDPILYKKKKWKFGW